MFTKSRTLALGVAIAGAIGFGAPMAGAATKPSLPGSSGGNVTSIANQVQSLNCGNIVPGGPASGALSGKATGSQSLASGQAFVQGLLNGATGKSATAKSGANCGLTSKQVQALICGGTLPTGTQSAGTLPGGTAASQSLAAFMSQYTQLSQGAVSSAGANCGKSSK